MGNKCLEEEVDFLQRAFKTVIFGATIIAAFFLLILFFIPRGNLEESRCDMCGICLPPQEITEIEIPYCNFSVCADCLGEIRDFIVQKSIENKPFKK